MMGIRINGILYQLLDDRSRTLYHLTSSNLVGDGIGEKTNDIHYFFRQLKISIRSRGRT